MKNGTLFIMVHFYRYLVSIQIKKVIPLCQMVLFGAILCLRLYYDIHKYQPFSRIDGFVIEATFYILVFFFILGFIFPTKKSLLTIMISIVILFLLKNAGIDERLSRYGFLKYTDNEAFLHSACVFEPYFSREKQSNEILAWCLRVKDPRTGYLTDVFYDSGEEIAKNANERSLTWMDAFQRIAQNNKKSALYYVYFSVSIDYIKFRAYPLGDKFYDVKFDFPVN